jgi:glycosyltransferase involved in cell wall biosynthesis
VSASAAKPNLLVLASTYPRWSGDHEPGFVHELVKRLTGTFHVIVLCPHAQGAAPTETMDGVEVIRYRYAPAALETLVNNGGIVTNLRNHRAKLLLVPSFVLLQAWHAWRLCRQRPIGVVHAHWLIPQGLIAALLGRPFVVTSHGADLYALRSAPLQALKRWVLGKAQAATVVSSAMRDMVGALGADVTRVSVLPMGVDMAGRFVPGDAAQRSPDELLFVGRLVEKKGLRYLLDALPLVLRERPGVTLTIAGFGPDEVRLKAQAHALGVQDAVRFMGAVAQADLPDLYRRAALFVAPFVKAESGDQEGLPVALMEAVASGCPVLAGYVAGLEDMLGADTDALTTDPRDTDGLTRRIVGSLADPQGAQAAAERVRLRVLDLLDWNNVANRTAALLRAACADGASIP